MFGASSSFAAEPARRCNRRVVRLLVFVAVCRALVARSIAATERASVDGAAWARAARSLLLSGWAAASPDAEA